jgi:hypothetical protein
MNSLARVRAPVVAHKYTARPSKLVWIVSRQSIRRLMRRPILMVSYNVVFEVLGLWGIFFHAVVATSRGTDLVSLDLIYSS